MNVRSIVVTGGFGCLGRVVAASFAARGDKVARIDFAPSAPDVIEGAIDLGGIDLVDAAAVDTAVAAVTAELGGIDVLVNIAGGFTWETLAGGSIASWERMFAMNVRSAATITKASLPAITRSKAGRIINIGAASAVQAVSGMGAYAASKAAVNMVMRSLAIDLAPRGITCVVVNPGWVLTDMGGPHATLTPAESVKRLRDLIETFGPAQSGKFFNHDGREYPW